MKFIFNTYEDFLQEYHTYHFQQCSRCNGIREISLQDVDITIDYRNMHFKSLFVLSCTKCGASCLPEYSKEMISGCYSSMCEMNQYEGIFTPKNFKKEFNYCRDFSFNYDHKDYYNIPGLSYDEEHSEEGFLTPVYFKKKALLHFMHDPEYKLSLSSETYGFIADKESGPIPFGINRNELVVFWLGDLNHMNREALSIMKAFNVESDHQLIDSEFYAAQMGCEWSNPNKEISICEKKETLFKIILDKYNINLFHLTEEIKAQKENFNKPIVFTEQSIEPSINMLHKVLVEGTNVSEFRKLYGILFPKSKEKYNEWKSIKLYQGLLKNILNEGDDIKDIISPLYLLNDLRQCYDHLLPANEVKSKKENVVKSLNIGSFENIGVIYEELLRKLSVLLEYLICGYSDN